MAERQSGRRFGVVDAGRIAGVLSSIFEAAKDWKLWEGDNPAAGVDLGREKEAREKRAISAEDLRRIITATADACAFIVMIAFGTGLRVSEILGLRWRNIDLEAGTLSVEQRWYRGDLDDPKTDASKRVRQLGAPLAVEAMKRVFFEEILGRMRCERREHRKQLSTKLLRMPMALILYGTRERSTSRPIAPGLPRPES